MTDHTPVTELTTEACWELLHEQELGRLAFHLADEVHLVPVNYAVDHDRRLVLRTAEGSTLLGLTMDADVAFEVDEVTDDVARSVVIRGRAHELHGAEADAVDQLPLRPWVDGVRSTVVAIEVDELSGRRFVLHRPWLHLRQNPPV
ncbi:pyridoxamine 5'-phosphate oxidase family protein [Oryzobacter telluris]|uniref:pyridoxamine 5'-phosphate oxidase family protein n=1 Tax=Oryzobacter telluris TaxID=3149179 RepID=UPI00370DB2BD